MDNKTIAAILDEIAVLLELSGENPFKTRAFSAAARTVELLNEDLASLAAEGHLPKIKGIGPAIGREIIALVQEGVSPQHQELKGRLPEGLLTMMRLPGMGPKKIGALYRQLGISSLAQLEKCCREDRLLALPGFGTKSQANIIQAIQQQHLYAGQYRFGEVIDQAREMEKVLAACPQVIRTSLAGSLRRCKEVVKDIDLLASSHQPGEVIRWFTDRPEVAEVRGAGETKASVVLQGGVGLDLRVVSDLEFPYALHHFTGSREHNTAMRHRAKTMDLKLNEYGLFRPAGQNIPCASEGDLFRALGLMEIPPELRESSGEIEAAASGTLPRLVIPEDIRGVLHVHSVYSDGTDSIVDLVHSCQALGWSYLGICDHSRSAMYANGLSLERLEQQMAEIDRLNRQNPDFIVFKGIESDILRDGSLDYPDEILARFDFVIGSVHSGMKMSETEATERLLRAMANPYLTILGHPTGRLLLGREGYPLDMKRIIDGARDFGVAIEMNANPYRMDLDWRWCRYAKAQGVEIPINPDAHHREDLVLALQGVGVARKGWLEAGDVLNTMTAVEIKRYFQRRKP